MHFSPLPKIILLIGCAIVSAGLSGCASITSAYADITCVTPPTTTRALEAITVVTHPDVMTGQTVYSASEEFGDALIKGLASRGLATHREKIALGDGSVFHPLVGNFSVPRLGVLPASRAGDTLLVIELVESKFAPATPHFVNHPVFRLRIVDTSQGEKLLAAYEVKFRSTWNRAAARDLTKKILESMLTAENRLKSTSL